MALVVVSNPTKVSWVTLINERHNNTIYKSQKVKIGHTETEMNNEVITVAKGLENKQPDTKEVEGPNSVTPTFFSPIFASDRLAPSSVSPPRLTPPNGYFSTFIHKVVLPTTKPEAVSSKQPLSLNGDKGNNSRNSTKTTSRSKRKPKKSKRHSATTETRPVVSSTARYIQQIRYDEFLRALDAQCYIRPEFTVNHTPHRASGLGNVIYGIMSTAFIASVTGRSFHSKLIVCLFV